MLVLYFLKKSRFLLAAAPLLACCVGGHDPFSDSSNAGIVIVRQSVRSGDTVRIFGTETLQVIVTVKELVRQIAVSSPHNRRFSNPDTTIAAAQFGGEPFTFYFSYYDTGWNRIILSAIRTGGAPHSDTIDLYVISPLH
ncbi:MAG: hypothetical protein PHC61_09080, partial [Chitinivibrionales bacterium]|nr:hypothetical protein [Chitinivibrionales bacterium]